MKRISFQINYLIFVEGEKMIFLDKTESLNMTAQ